MDIKIRKLEAADWLAVREIYYQGILTGTATFETDIPEWEDWNRAHRQDCRIVAPRPMKGKELVGWAAITPVSERCVYDGVGEVSVYVGENYRGRGIGKILLEALIEESEAAGLWTLQAGMFPENEASLALHERCDFMRVGLRRRIGQLNGAWRDVILLERRSERVG